MSTQTRSLAAEYDYRVFWSVEDAEFVATCAEFPSVSWLAHSQAEALSGVTQLVGEIIDDMSASGEEIPLPLSRRSYSGKFNVRMPQDLHRRLARESAEQNVSLNQYVVRKLAS